MRSLFILFSILFSFTSFAQSSDLRSTRPILFTKPLELDWKSLNWETINFDRIPVDGGAAIYSISSPNSAKFKVTMTFPGGAYFLPEKDRTALSATSDLLIRGGFGNLNFEQIQNYLTEYVINLQTTINPAGQLVVSADALTEDFPRVLDLLYALLLKPRFEEKALDLWKIQSKNAFTNLLNSNTLEKQVKFLDAESHVLAFGKDHYLAKSLYRISPNETEKVNNQKVKEIYQKIINRNGLFVSLSGKFNQDNIQNLKKLILQIPRYEPPVNTWLPSRDFEKNKNKIRAVIIKKDDMTQSNIMLRYYFPNLGRLNSIEKSQYEILQEVFSSTGGVVGNDRFSKALRADSGISYSPHAYFIEDPIYPNTNVGVFHLFFQSPNERLAEAVTLAQKTWDIFLKEGVSEAELNSTRSSMINRLLATEFTVFDKADQIMSKIEQNKLPSSDPIEEQLVKLDAQRDVSKINQITRSLLQEQTIPVLVIMGNPDEKQISALKKSLDLDQIDIIDIHAIVGKP